MMSFLRYSYIPKNFIINSKQQNIVQKSSSRYPLNSNLFANKSSNQARLLACGTSIKYFHIHHQNIRNLTNTSFATDGLIYHHHHHHYYHHCHHHIGGYHHRYGAILNDGSDKYQAKYYSTISDNKEHKGVVEQQEIDLIEQRFDEIQPLFHSKDFDTVQHLYSEWTQLLFSVNVEKLKSENAMDRLRGRLETMLQHIQHIEGQSDKEGMMFPLFKAYWSVSGVYQQLREFEASLDFLEKTWSEIYEKGRKEDIHFYEPLINITKGTIFTEQGRIEEGVALHSESLKKIGKNINEDNGTQVATAYCEIGQNSLNCKRYDEAIQMLSRSLSILESFFGWTHPLTTKVSSLLADAMLRIGNLELGIITGEKALVGLELYYPQNISQITDLTLKVCKAHERKSRFRASQLTNHRITSLFKRLEKMYEAQEFAECNFKLGNALASSHYFKGDFMQALAVLQRQQKSLPMILPKWRERNESDAKFEVAYMKYFRALSTVGIERYEMGVKLLREVQKEFEEINRKDWADQCKQNIQEVSDIVAKKTQSARNDKANTQEEEK